MTGSPSRRVLMVLNDGDYFLRHRLPIAQRLVKCGAELTVLAGGNPAPPQKTGIGSFSHIPLDRLSIDPVSNLRLFFSLLGHMRRVRPEAVHLITLKPAIFGGFAAVLLRMVGQGPQRILVTIPGLGRLMSPGGRGAGAASAVVRSAVGAMVRLLSASKAIHFTFETESDRRSWIGRGYIREDNSTVVNGAGVDPARFFPAAAPPAPPVKVLFASRLLRSKGLGLFLQLARRFASQPDVEFLVAGWGDAADADSVSHEELAGEPAIRFLGEVADMPALLRDVHIACLPTRYGEGIPRILIEAAASGLPSIATEIEGCRMAVADGRSGRLVAVGEDVPMLDEIEAALRTYLADPDLRARHGTAARELFSERGFSEDAVTGQFVELLGFGDDTRDARHTPAPQAD